MADDEKTYTIKITGGPTESVYTVTDKINRAQLGRILLIVTSSDNLPPTELPSSHSLSRHYAKRRTKTEFPSPVQVRPELEKLQLEPISGLYGNYWRIKTKSDRVMWILATLNEKGFESVNQKEISFIAEKFSDNIPTKFMTSLLNSHKKGGRITPTLMGTVRAVRILKPGLDYVKSLLVEEKKDDADKSVQEKLVS